MGKKVYYKPQRKKSLNYFFSVLFFAWLLALISGADSELLVGLLTLTGMSYGGYKLVKGGLQLFGNQIELRGQGVKLRLENLKDAIRNADKKIAVLDDYLTKKAYTQYAVLARQLLPEVSAIKKEADQLQKHIEPHIYQRISRKAEEVSLEIRSQLQRLDVDMQTTKLSQEEERVAKIAPELLKTYRNIKTDHETILEKIKTSDNQAELEALHETNMKRFRDILEGYLKIKETPKNFHNAEERLTLARQALEQFDLELDQSLRELNESDLADFEVSLRMMSKNNHDPLQDSTLD